jgi:hypothetical protein
MGADRPQRENGSRSQPSTTGRKRGRLRLPPWFIGALGLALPLITVGAYLGGPLGAVLAAVGGQMSTVSGVLLAVTYRNGRE